MRPFGVARYSPRFVNIGTIHAAAFSSSHPRIIATGFGPPKLAGLDPAEALGPVERGLLFLEEAAPRLRLRYGRRRLARRGGAEGVVAGCAAAEGREVEGHFFLLVAARRRSVAVLPRWCLWRLWLPSSERVFAGIPRHGDEAVW